jgi:TonB family protein
MTDTFWLLAAALCALLGMVWLALALPAHWKQVYPERTNGPWKAGLRTGGWTALLLSGLACLKADHATMAVLVWVMLLAAAAATVALVLSGTPRRVRVIGPDTPGKGFWLTVPLLSGLVYAGVLPTAEQGRDPAAAEQTASVAGNGEGMETAVAAAPAASAAGSAAIAGRNPPAEPALSDRGPIAQAEPETPVEPPVEPASKPEPTTKAALRPVPPAPIAAGDDSGAPGDVEHPAGDAGSQPDSMRDYVAALYARLERHRMQPPAARYPRPAGSALVYLVIERDGTLGDHRLAASSGDRQLDQAALALIRRARPLPPLPPALGQQTLALVLPVAFPPAAPPTEAMPQPVRPIFVPVPVMPPPYPVPWHGMPLPGPAGPP